MDSEQEVLQPPLWKMEKANVLIAWENEAMTVLKNYPGENMN